MGQRDKVHVFGGATGRMCNCRVLQVKLERTKEHATSNRPKTRSYSTNFQPITASPVSQCLQVFFRMLLLLLFSNFHWQKLFAHEIQIARSGAGKERERRKQQGEQLKSKIVYQAKRLAKCLPCQFANSPTLLRREEVVYVCVHCLRLLLLLFPCCVSVVFLLLLLLLACSWAEPSRCSACLAIKRNDKCKCPRTRSSSSPTHSTPSLSRLEFPFVLYFTLPPSCLFPIPIPIPVPAVVTRIYMQTIWSSSICL